MSVWTLLLSFTDILYHCSDLLQFVNLRERSLYHALSYEVRCYKRHNLLCPKHQVAHAWVTSIETK
jgi:hypothetical protein